MSIEIWTERYIHSDWSYEDGRYVRTISRSIAIVPDQNGIYDSEVGRIGVGIRRIGLEQRIKEVVLDFLEDRTLRSKTSGKSQRCFHIDDFGLGYQELGINEILFIRTNEGDRWDFIDFMK